MSRNLASRKVPVFLGRWSFDGAPPFIEGPGCRLPAGAEAPRSTNIPCSLNYLSLLYSQASGFVKHLLDYADKFFSLGRPAVGRREFPAPTGLVLGGQSLEKLLSDG